MVLTQRLLKIANMVKYESVADIGTDHAKLPVYLLENNIAKKVIASDVAEGPVLACRKTVSESGLSDKIDIRAGDGLATLTDNEIETIIIAGMGGDLISYIISKDVNIARKAKEVILQPMTHIPELRKFLHDNDFMVIEETLVQEKDKIYTIIKVKAGNNQYKNDIDYIISPILVDNRDKLLKKLLEKLIKKYKTELKGVKKALNPDVRIITDLEVIIENLEKIYETAKDY